MQWHWPEDDVVMYGRRYRSVKTGWGCFAKTRWVATDDYYSAQCTRPNRAYFRVLMIVPVVYNPQIHYVIFDPRAPFHYGHGWDAPFPLLHGQGDWGFPPWFGGLGHNGFANMGDPGVPEDFPGFDDWRNARHSENMARLDREMNEITDRPRGYVEDLIRGWQDGGDSLDDNPDRRRLRRLWSEIADLEQQRDHHQRRNMERFRQQREEQRLSRYYADHYLHGRRGGGRYR